MAVSLNVNSYVTVADADTYFGNRLDVAAWTSADEPMKSQALVTAAQMLDDMSWAGTVLQDDQPLAFPRVVEYFDPKLGTSIYLDGTTVPNRIVRANMELAYHLLNNDGLLDDSGKFDNISVGPISIQNMKPASKMPLYIKNIIKPLLVNKGSNSWWRAN
jgi:hypothetical protein